MLGPWFRASLLPLLLPMAGACGASRASDAGTADGPAAPADNCAVLFGRPNASTGLTGAQCRPECTCGEKTWVAPSYDDAFIQSLIDDWALAEPHPEVTADPYLASAPADADPPDTVCAVLPGAEAKPRSYQLVTYASEVEARAAGASPTHFGRCGVCSTLADLAVFIRNNDLTAPVRECGMKGIAQGDSATLACLRSLGFTLPCAQIWFYNTLHTRRACLDVCMNALASTYHQPDGTLNPCLQCDEAQSGAVFKAVAGRTRRNSGLPNAMCRPCAEVRPLVHDYQ